MSKALILVGGFGTRLRPLTLSTPKPIVPFCNKMMIMHQIEALVEAGVKTIVLAVAYKPDEMAKKLKPELDQLDVKVIYSHEKTPLGTAGPLKLAEQYLKSDQEPFFVLNADVTCDYNFTALLEFHKAHKQEGTIMVTRVEEPSRYGVVLYDDKGKIEKFVEKPKKFVGNRINAGLYIFNPSILKRIQADTPTSIEREVFPPMAEEGQLYAMDLEGFWMDVGQPPDFLVGTSMKLKCMLKKNDTRLYKKKETDEFQVIEPCIIDASAKIGKGSLIGPNAVVGPECIIGEGVRLHNTTLMSGVEISNNSWLKNSIIGWDSHIGKWCRIGNVSVFGEDVSVRDELYINGGKVLPHKEIKENIPVPAVIL